MITDSDTFDTVLDLSLNKIIDIMPHETRFFIILFIVKFTEANITLVSDHNIDKMKKYITT